MWNSKGLCDENIKPPLITNNSLNPGINYFDNAAMRVKFEGNCLKQEQVIFRLINK